MILRILISYILIFLSTVIVSHSAPDVDPEDKIDLTGLKNPFVSLLPKEEPKVAPVKVAPPVKSTPVVPPKPVIVDIKAAGLKLNGVVWGGVRPQAIMNSRVVSVGDEIQAAKILAITQEGVQVLYKETKFDLRID